MAISTPVPIASAPGRKATSGRVIGRNGNTMVIEVLADLSVGLNSIWGEAGVLAIVKDQVTRLAPVRRVNSETAAVVVCDGHEAMTGFYLVDIYLDPRDAPKAVPIPSQDQITAPP